MLKADNEQIQNSTVSGGASQTTIQREVTTTLRHESSTSATDLDAFKSIETLLSLRNHALISIISLHGMNIIRIGLLKLNSHA